MFCKVEQPPLSDKAARLLKVAEHVILSQDNKLVMQNEVGMMCDNKGYSFSERYMCKVHVFKRDWIALTHRERSSLRCVFIWEKDQESVYETWYSFTESMVR